MRLLVGLLIAGSLLAQHKGIQAGSAAAHNRSAKAAATRKSKGENNFRSKKTGSTLSVQSIVSVYGVPAPVMITLDTPTPAQLGTDTVDSQAITMVCDDNGCHRAK